MTQAQKEKMNIVIVGHVDHGKSTVIGRLLADTDSLPEGKLAQIKAQCERNAKPFEYAFLLDALKDEQSQGITIDMARCFFKSKVRDYIIIDAPGHIEFLKNMVTGAARAEAAVLVIDAKEGICENSKRHAYLLSMLGIRQVIVCVNKMDLVNYDQKVFHDIKTNYTEFLQKQVGIEANAFVPVSAFHGENIATPSEKMTWSEGHTVLQCLDEFQKEKALEDKPFRFFLQDVYKFTKEGDDRRIFAGRVEAGKFSVGDSLIFLPSKKKTTVASIEGFHEDPQTQVKAGKSTGFTVTEQIYAQRGELVCKVDEPLPQISSQIRANLFWMGREPMVVGKTYYLKVGTVKTKVELKEILLSIDVTQDLKAEAKTQIERHDVVECVLQTKMPIAFDLNSEMQETSRFVIVDQYEISGGGIILEALSTEQSPYVEESLKRELHFERGSILPNTRMERYNQKPALILVNGDETGVQKTLAKALEKNLFESGKHVYYMGFGGFKYGVDSDISLSEGNHVEHLRRFGEVGYLMLDAGMVLVASLRNLESADLKMIQTLVHPYEVFVLSFAKNELGLKDNFLNLEKNFDANDITQKIQKWIADQNS